MQANKSFSLRKTAVIAYTSILISGCAAFKPHVFRVDEETGYKEWDPHWSFDIKYLFEDKPVQKPENALYLIGRRATATIKSDGSTYNKPQHMPDTSSFYVQEPEFQDISTNESVGLENKLFQ